MLGWVLYSGGWRVGAQRPTRRSGSPGPASLPWEVLHHPDEVLLQAPGSAVALSPRLLVVFSVPMKGIASVLA